MCKEITVKEAIKQLNRYDNEFYTPANRMAHRMAIAALTEQMNSQNEVDTDNNEECTENS